MNPLFAKLNYKEQPEIHVVNAPPFMSSPIQEMQALCRVKNRIGNGNISFVLVFVMNSEEIEQYARQLEKSLNEDAIVWFAYPKKSSKKYKTEINRDSGWEPLGKLGLEPVRQVALDEDWSALRFRDPDFIKLMKRDSRMTISQKGNERTKKK